MAREQTEYDTKKYKAARAELLRDQPVCHWCRRATATELDHLVEHDEGGTIDDGYVPACKPCNSRRGAEYINKKTAMRIQNRNNGFLYKIETPPSPIQSCLPISPDQPEPAKINHDQPRLETIVPDCDGSWARVVGDIALEHLGIELMPWQMHYLENLLSFSHSPDGQDDLVHRSGLLSVARQCGKSVLLQCVILFWLLEMPKIRGTKQTVLSTAHTLSLSTMLFEELAPLLEDRFGAKIYKTFGRNSATMPDGSRWMVRAANPSVGHGMSVDLAIVDELFDVSELAMAGLMPTQRARRSPLLLMASTAGTESSAAFIRFRENALRLIDKKQPSNFYFAEWSIPPALDPMQESSWLWANPAIGHTLRIETLRAESQDPDRANFLRSSCNMWIASTQSWIQTHLWPDLEYDGPIPTGGVISVEASMDESRYFATRSVALGDGRTCVSVAFTAETAKELWAHVAALAADPAIKFIFSPTIDAHCPPVFERRRVVMGYKEILQYTPIVRNMISEGRIVHTGEAMLAEHVCRAVMVRTQGSIAVSSQKSAGPIELCRTMIWGAAAAARPGNSQKPSMILIAN